jgi:hypothetical protein
MIRDATTTSFLDETLGMWQLWVLVGWNNVIERQNRT